MDIIMNDWVRDLWSWFVLNTRLPEQDGVDRNYWFLNPISLYPPDNQFMLSPEMTITNIGLELKRLTPNTDFQARPYLKDRDLLWSTHNDTNFCCCIC